MRLINRPSCLSSSLMTGVNLYRNNQGVLNKFQAQIAYPFIATVALVESVVYTIFNITSLLALPFNDLYLKKSVELLGSSLFTIIWSTVDFIINPFCEVVVADEDSARIIALSGNLFMMPEGALI